MMTVLLYGFLGKQFGRVHKFAVRTPAEAVRALCANYPKFRGSIEQGGSYKVLRGGKEYLGEENLHDPQSYRETIRIVPVVEGAGAVARIIVGVILIVVAWWNPMAWGTTAVLMMGATGASLVMGGVSELLMANSKSKSVESPDNKPSYSFDGAVNTVRQGNPIPICYGKLIVGSQIISGGMSAEQI